MHGFKFYLNISNWLQLCLKSVFWVQDCRTKTIRQLGLIVYGELSTQSTIYWREFKPEYLEKICGVSGRVKLEALLN
jgi:hypothetical protein